MPSNQSAPSKQQVWSLNYHEVTQDPRVFKQARALTAAGYDVRVLSDRADAVPLNEAIDGVEITRFDWADYTKLTQTDSDMFAFASDAFDFFRSEFDTLVQCADAIRDIVASYPELQDELTDLRNFKNYYRNAEGAERESRQTVYRRRRLSRSLKSVISVRDRQLRSALKQIERQHQIARRAFRDLHQGRAFVFAANVLRLELAERPALVHAHDIYTLVGGVLLARRHGAKLIYDAHEMETARATNMGPTGGEVIAKLESACFEFTDAMITVSASIADDYSQRFRKAAPVVIMNAPELTTQEHLEPVDFDVRTATGLEAETPIVVFTGGIQQGHRGVDKVLEALTYLPGVHLVTLGPRHERNDAWFEKAAEKLSVRDRVHMLDPVDARDVVAAISTASVSVIPFQAVSLNHEYAMPNKLFEAAFARVPLAVSNLTEMKRFVEELGIGRSMDQTDPEDIAEAIQFIIENPQDFRGKDDIATLLKDQYSWGAQVGKLEALYRSVLR